MLERGKRLDVKSKAEETEYPREWVFGRREVACVAGLEAERGSSRDNDCFREEDMPDGEEGVGDEGVMGLEDAREASSSESRG